MKTILIIPCYNDNSHLKTLLDSISLENILFDILIIDDGSKKEVSIKSANHNILLIRNDINRGKGYSIKKGLEYAFSNQYTHAITLDADLQHDPKYINKFIEIDKNVNIVIGARSFDKTMPFHRRLSNSITSFIISILTRKKIEDSQSGYRRYKLSSKSFADCIEDGFQFESEILINELRLDYASLEHISIPTLYNNEKSSINNVLDTYKFIKLILRKIIDR